MLEGDNLIGVEMTNGEDEILIASSSGKCIRFSEKDVRATGRGSQGVKSMSLTDDEQIIDMTIVKAGTQIVTISELGYGKRSSVDEYRLQGRGGMGIKAGVFNEKTGKLVALKQTNGDQDLLIIADNGIIIRTPVDAISSFSRVSQGVKVMKLRGDAKIVAVALAEKEDEEQSHVEGEIEE